MSIFRANMSIFRAKLSTLCHFVHLVSQKKDEPEPVWWSAT